MKKYLWYVILFSVLLILSVAMIIPYIPLYGESLGLTVGMIGYVVALYQITQIVGRVPLGTISDFIGYKRVIGLGGLSVVFGSITYFSSSYLWPFMFVAQALFGVAFSTVWVAIPAFMTEFGRNKLPVFTFSVGWAFAFASPLGGFIKDAFGMEYLFFFAFILSMPLLLLVFLICRNYPESRNNNSRNPGLKRPSIISFYKKSFGTIRNPQMLRVVLFSFLTFMGFTMGFSIL